MATIFTSLLVLLSITKSSAYLKCYGSEMQEENCHPMQLWCVEWRNATTVTRGCADVVLCPDEEDGCFPLNDSEHDERWCCCKENFCNSSQRPSLLHALSIFVLLFGFC